MSKRLTTEEFIEKARKIHGDKYDYSKVEYKSATEKVIIICPIHGEFLQDPSNHLQRKGRTKCARERNHNARVKTTEEFINQATNIHGNKYDYYKVIYRDAHSKVSIICPEYGIFLQTPNNHLNGNSCPKCAKKYSLPEEEFIKKAKEIHGNKYDYQDLQYSLSNKKVKIKCPIHGDFYQYRALHLSGSGCFMCGAEKRGLLRRKSTETFIEQANKVHNNKYDYSQTEYILSKNKVKIICPQHREFWQTPRDHLTGDGCPYCKLKSQHTLFDKLKLIFIDHPIIFEASKKDVCWIGLQRLDIYFPDINVAIEYDGRQHFIPVDFFGGQEGLNYRINKDTKKEACCKANNCTLFRLAYDYTDEDFQNLVNKIKQIYDCQ